MNLIVDIDDTLIISEHYEGQYINPKPIQEEIEKLNELYDTGYKVILWTARGWNHYEITKEQLKKFGVKYNELLMGKPLGYHIDNNSHKSVHDFFMEKYIGK